MNAGEFVDKFIIENIRASRFGPRFIHERNRMRRRQDVLTAAPELRIDYDSPQ